jgi:hypothetical protein
MGTQSTPCEYVAHYGGRAHRQGRSGVAATVGRSQHMASMRGPCRGCRVERECTQYPLVDSECTEYSSVDWAHYRR